MKSLASIAILLAATPALLASPSLKTAGMFPSNAFSPLSDCEKQVVAEADDRGKIIEIVGGILVVIGGILSLGSSSSSK